MKKLIAILLVLVMVLSLAACGKKPVENPDGSGESQSANAGDSGNSGGSGDKGNSSGGDMGGGLINPGGYTDGTLSHEGGEGLGGSGNAEITSNDDLINPAFKGKTLQVWGYSGAEFDYIDEMGKGSFIWMVRAAVDEWAALNDVTIVFEGNYDQNAVLGAINSGEKPDILLEGDRFPLMANLGIIRPLTDTEYTQLKDTCGQRYMDLMMFKGECYGFNQPWSGNVLFYYNKTVFEEYGVKTPKEYYMEDNWTWETMVECMKAVTKDLDGDGKYDTYGTGIMNLGLNQKDSYYYEDETGRLVVNTEEKLDKLKKQLELYYTGRQEGWFGDYARCTIATSPRPVTHMGDAEWYNFEHLNQTLVNGDVVETIFPPKYDNTYERLLNYTQCYMSIFSTCDEPEAALSLLTYILRVGMRYMSEFSCGLYGCNYEGIRGVTAYSLGWRENFQEIVEQRQADFEALEEWDQDLFNKMYEDVLNSPGMIGRYYPGWETFTDSSATDDLPPASAFPILYEKNRVFAENYNKNYLN